jgi:predicted lipoprotein with Yx(FWY)xxD motif
MELNFFPRHPLGRIPATLLFACAALLVVAATARAQTQRVVKEEQNATLGRTILTNTKGRTLYSLSAETGGRFYCTGNCLVSWRPLLVPPGVKPTGPVKLGTIKRPNGKIQVTYKGRPLYRFNGDAMGGEANGEGLKDVGTWHAATVDMVSSPAPEPEPVPPYPY